MQKQFSSLGVKGLKMIEIKKKLLSTQRVKQNEGNKGAMRMTICLHPLVSINAILLWAIMQIEWPLMMEWRH